MPTPDLTAFARLVRERRKSTNVSQTKLAATLKISNRTLSDVENAVSWPRMPVVLALCRTLGIELPKGLEKTK